MDLNLWIYNAEDTKLAVNPLNLTYKKANSIVGTYATTDFIAKFLICIYLFRKIRNTIYFFDN